MKRPITITNIVDGQFVPKVVMGERVLTDLHTRYNFFIHEAVDEDDDIMFTISEEVTGAAIANGSAREICLKIGRKNLSGVTTEQFEVMIDNARKAKEVARDALREDCLQQALISAGLTATYSETQDIRGKLKELGYEITRIIKSNDKTL
jgi:hypothetical protein